MPGNLVYTVNEVTQKVAVLRMPLPKYTGEAREKKIEGVVIVDAVCSPAREVADIQVFQGLPHGLSENVIEAAKNIEFNPAIKDGRAVSQKVRFGYYFNLRNEKATTIRV